ncbi:MAG: hypothetical protein AB8G95_20830 [Anaerolineae bacterium]
MRITRKLRFSQLLFIGTFFLLALLITACEEDNLNSGIPTIAPEYLDPTPMATFTRLPTLTPITNPTATRELPLKTIVIFDDGFKNGWEMVPEDVFAEFTNELVYDGENSIKVSPRLDGSSIYIVVGPDSRVPIRREDIINISFYLNGASAPISFDEMTITAQGSNVSTSWNKNDRSAITSSDAVFQRTQLAFLGVSSIPADTWGRVEFSVQDQLFDPLYENLTGFYLSSYSNDLAPFYVDRIEILLFEE